MNFWNTAPATKFFKEALKNFAPPEQLFYKLSDAYFASAPKGKTNIGSTHSTTADITF